MRKVFLKFILALSLVFGSICFFNSNVAISNSIESRVVPNGPEYTYEKVLIDDRWWIFVYDDQGRLVEVYPDESGSGGPCGGG